MKISSSFLHYFRKEFTYPAKDVAHFFPQHMAKGLSKMQRTLANVDYVIEVHDARVPLSGRNQHFKETLAVRPHLLVLNKMDLTDLRYKSAVIERLKADEGVQDVLYTNCKQAKSSTVKRLLVPKLTELLSGAARFHREGLDHYNILIIGLPNVGKSSLINAMRHLHTGKGKATPVGPHAGVTRSVMERIKVSHNPLMYVYDTPGIMMPNIDDMDVGMKLALCGTLTDHLVGYDMIADYLLFWLNSHGYFKYVKYFNLPEPTDDIYHLLSHVAKLHGAVEKRRSSSGDYVYKPNFDHAARYVIKAYREGQLGCYNLDEDIIQSVSK